MVVTYTAGKEGTSMIMLPAMRLKLMHLDICAHSGIVGVGTRAEQKAWNGEGENRTSMNWSTGWLPMMKSPSQSDPEGS